MLSMGLIRALLLEHDDPHHLERPADFDLATSRECFARLVSALKERFGPSCSRGLAQDASFYGVIDVPADATGLGRPIRVVMSNFGSYFVTADVVVGEGVPSGEAGLTEEFVTWLDGVCTAAGCTFVPADLLREPYDGPSVLEAHRDEELVAALVAAGEVTEDEDDEEEVGKAYWHDRYFEYM
ncbi:hypothetical protein [Streptomyces sp. CB03238]|uniref:hypothetical protein n=1 Tax=Streptomyces sp. CB03238 TaxID=1907777 RepID=UPI000A121CBF|nr:hypothetical protein [Streptomyces sp. CB03238]ORT53760.1 hypothetical protein BKD26_37355 [Streptomyces sp. CB03238]